MKKILKFAVMVVDQPKSTVATILRRQTMKTTLRLSSAAMSKSKTKACSAATRQLTQP